MILFVDDEVRRIGFHIEEMEALGLVVTTAGSVSAARQVLAGNEPVELVVLDIMLPWGEDIASADASDGIGGGLSLLRDIRARSPELPVVLFTNAHRTEHLLDRDKATHFCRKVDYLPYQFAAFIKGLLAGEPT